MDDEWAMDKREIIYKVNEQGMIVEESRREDLDKSKKEDKIQDCNEDSPLKVPHPRPH